jgi:hypothetical protein
VHYYIDHAMLENKFRGHSTIGQFYMHGSLNDTRAREADQRSRFGENDIA